MKLLTLQEVELRRGDQLYRESSVIPFFVSLISFGIAVWILFLYSNGDAPLFIAVVSGGGLILFSFLCFHIFKKSFSANNWYVAVKPVGTLLIKFRSHLNELLPASDKQVVLLLFSEIDSVGITKQTEKSDSADGTKVQYFTFFDIHTNCDNLEVRLVSFQWIMSYPAMKSYFLTSSIKKNNGSASPILPETQG